MTDKANFVFNAIGYISSCYSEKFGIPRQPGLVDSESIIEISPEYASDEAFKYLDSFSHVWVIFVFHDVLGKGWKPMVRPPRLGGNKKVGLFASRSMFRPNPIGLSVVSLHEIIKSDQVLKLVIGGGDFLDGTPVLDIKPYLPYSDIVNNTRSGFADSAPEIKYKVYFSATATTKLQENFAHIPKFKELIKSILELDPRPAYSSGQGVHKLYGLKLYDVDIKWQVEDKVITVTDIVK